MSIVNEHSVRERSAIGCGCGAPLRFFAALLHKTTEGYNLPYDKRIDMADACSP